MREPLQLSLHVADGRAALVLSGRRAAGWLTIERIELEIPDVTPPFDLAGGAAKFQRRRCRARRALLSLDDAGLDAWLRRRSPALVAAGMTDVRVRFLAGVVEVSARAQAGERSAELTVRARLTPVGRGLRVTVDGVRLYGWLGRPATLVAHDLVAAVLGARPGASGAEAPRIRGLGDYEAFPLDTALWALLPPAGWRLPDTRSARLAAARLGRGRLDLEYLPETVASGAASAPGLAAAAEVTMTSEATRAGDARVLAGDLAGAAVAYRAAAAAAGDDTIVERLLALLAGDESTLAEAERMARDVVAREPQHVPARLALAGVALAQGRTAEGAAALGRVVELAEAAGDDEDAVRAALAAGRLTRSLDAAQSVRHFETVLERRPAHAEAAEALAERYADDGRWADLVRLSHRRIASAIDRKEQAREHLRAGEIYLTRLGDAARARVELERATALHDGDPRGWEVLARALVDTGDRAAAVRALEKQAQIFAAKGDGLGEGRAHLRIGDLWQAGGDDDRAHLRYRRALEILPGDSDALERLATVAGRRGATVEALAAWERLAGLAVTDDGQRRRAERERARLHLAAGDVAPAEAALERAAGGPPSEEAERLVLAGEAADRRDDAPAAAALRERAYALAPDVIDGSVLARLAESARRHGDADAERRWLDRLLAAPRTKALSDAARNDAVARRAELALAAGEAQAALALLEIWPEAGKSLLGRRLHAEALAATGERARAAAEFEALAVEVGAGPDSVALRLAAAQTQLADGDPVAALASAHAAASHDPGAARATLGEAAWRARSWEVVVTAYATPAAAEDARRLGAALEQLGRPADALPVYRSAVTQPTAAGEPLRAIWRQLGDLLERQGDLAAAAETFAAFARDARTADPPAARADAHLRAADLLRRNDATAKAIEELEAGLRLVPDHLPSLDALEAIHAAAGQSERVAVILGRKIAATARQPDRQKALLARLADLQDKVLGRPDVAREVHKRILDLDPNFAQSLAFLDAHK